MSKNSKVTASIVCIVFFIPLSSSTEDKTDFEGQSGNLPTFVEVLTLVSAAYRNYYPEGILEIYIDPRSSTFVKEEFSPTGEKWEVKIVSWEYDVFHNGVHMHCNIKDEPTTTENHCSYEVVIPVKKIEDISGT